MVICEFLWFILAAAYITKSSAYKDRLMSRGMLCSISLMAMSNNFTVRTFPCGTLSINSVYRISATLT